MSELKKFYYMTCLLQNYNIHNRDEDENSIYVCLYIVSTSFDTYIPRPIMSFRPGILLNVDYSQHSVELYGTTEMTQDIALYHESNAF